MNVRSLFAMWNSFWGKGIFKLKIMISPSKTQQHGAEYSEKLSISEPLHARETEAIYNEICKLSKDDMAKRFSIKGKILDSVYENYSKFKSLETTPAIMAYTGFVFKGLEIASYGLEEWEYITEHIRILSAFYGNLRPLDAIKAYRLDYKSKLDINLYDYWRETLIEDFKGETIVNLASDEFSKSVKLDMVTIKFLDEKDGKFKTIGTYAKQARGLFLNEIIKKHIDKLSSLKEISVMDYKFCENMSDEKLFVFKR